MQKYSAKPVTHPACRFDELQRVAIDGLCLLLIPALVEEPVWRELTGLCVHLCRSLADIEQGVMQPLALIRIQAAALLLGMKSGLIQHLQHNDTIGSVPECQLSRKLPTLAPIATCPAGQDEAWPNLAPAMPWLLRPQVSLHHLVTQILSRINWQ